MKNKVRIVMCCVMVGVLFFMLSGCNSIFKFDSITGKIKAPEPLVIGNVICWDSVNGAVSYEIYKNNELIETINDTYFVPNNDEIAQFAIKAIGETTSKNSEMSSAVVMYKQSGFVEDETMNIELTNGCFTIPSNINYVLVSGTSSSAYIVVEDRTTDLFVELNNVIMTSPEGKSCIMTREENYDASELRFGVTIKVNGISVLNGANYTTVPGTPNDNSEKKGYAGGNGGSGIVLPLISITGSGQITLNGGNGGKGGTGAASSGWSTSCYGNGGNGGNGGYGIKATKLVLTMSKEGIVKAYGGQGGSKGSPGSNGSIVSGPLNTSNWKNCYGDDGTDGESSLGDIKIIGGTYLS